MKTTFLALLLAAAPLAAAADVTGRFEPGTRYEEPAAHAPANVSRMFARAIDRPGSIELPATGVGGMIVWTISDAPATTRLRTPGGASLQPHDRGSLERGLRRFELDPAETAEMSIAGGAQEVVHVLRAAPASYHLDVDRAATVVVAEPDSPLVLSTWAAPLSRQPGQRVTLHAELRSRDTPVADAAVTARLLSPSGRTFDAIALVDRGDGIYTATLDDLPSGDSGAWQVRFEAAGVDAGGTRFARSGSGELVAERGAARLGKLHSEVVNDALRVTVPADVFDAGRYRLDVIVADQNGASLLWAEGVRSLTSGATTLSIDIPLDGVAKQDFFVDVRLLGLDVMGVAGRVTSR
jgi:hypothetical protein